MRRKMRFVHFGDSREGITVTVTRKGIEVHGFYDSFVGLEGGSISWEALEEMRREVNTKGAPRIA